VTFEKTKAPENNLQKAELEKNNIHLISFKYRRLGFLSMFSLAGKAAYLFFFILFKNISSIHCWCTPAGSLGYFLSVLTGKSLVIDSFEPHAEAMVENGEWKKNSYAYKFLFWLEKAQVKKAKYVIGLTSKTTEYIQLKYKYHPVNY